MNRLAPGGQLAHAELLAAWAQTHAFDIDPAVALRAILIWSRLHGLVSLEIAGNFTSMGIDPGQLFEAQLPGTDSVSARQGPVTGW